MNTAIIGGGIGGLTTALLLSKRGAAVTIYEKSDRLGGRLAYQEGGGFRVDQGPTIVLLPEMLLEVLAECGIDRSALELLPCDPMYRIHYADGTVFHKWRSLAQQLGEIRALFPPEEAESFKRYIDDMGETFRQGRRAFLERAFLRKRDFYTVSNLRLLAKAQAFRSVRGVAAKYFKSEKLRDAFSLQTLYIGGAPFQVPGLYTLLPYAEHAFGVWYLKGGYAGLVQVLEKELRSRGVTIHENRSVEEIVIDNGACRGLISGGQEQRYDAVVYNGDFPGMAGLMPSREANRRANEGANDGANGEENRETNNGANVQESGKRPLRVPTRKRNTRAFVPSSGCVLIYLGLNRQWPESQAHQFFLPPSLTDGLREIFEERRIPAEPSFYVFNPARMDEEAAPSGKTALYLLVPVPSGEEIDWTTEAGPLVERVLEQAEIRGFPGLRDAIEWMDVRTPADAQKDGLYRGGSFGIAPIFSQSAIFRPQVVPYPVAGLYAVGASLHPGGGIPIVMQGARLLVEQMEKEMKTWSSKPFSHSASL